MKSTIIGAVVALMTVFTFAIILTMQFNSNLDNDTLETIDDSIYTTQLVLFDQSEEIDSNEVYIRKFREHLQTQLKEKKERNIKYSVDIYGVDYEKGLMDAEVTARYKNLIGQERQVKSRRTMIIESVV
ncbi:MAG: hypothetical protein U0K95_05765 [Eubacterium sp.]|nr:hypothetical protein [Eubacterium sp.]